jgi:hypothetical protein
LPRALPPRGENLLDDPGSSSTAGHLDVKHLLQTATRSNSCPAPSRPSRPGRARPPFGRRADFLVADKLRLLTVGEKSLEVRLRDQLGLPGLRAVHRLDKDTSGCVLFAKDEETRAALVAQFEEGRVRKLYHALVAGNLAEPQMDVRVPVDHLPAVSHVRQVAAQTKPPRAAHLTVAIETGRTHQIRIHLHHLGHPVLGDGSISTPAAAIFPKCPARCCMPRAALRPSRHGKPVCATAPLPRDFRDWLRLCG